MSTNTATSPVKKQKVMPKTTSLADFQNSSNQPATATSDLAWAEDRFNNTPSEPQPHKRTAGEIEQAQRHRAKAAHGASTKDFNFRSDAPAVPEALAKCPTTPPYIAFVKGIPTNSTSEAAFKQHLQEKVGLTPNRLRIVCQGEAVMAFAELSTRDDMARLLSLGTLGYGGRILKIDAATESQRSGADRLFNPNSSSSISSSSGKSGARPSIVAADGSVGSKPHLSREGMGKTQHTPSTPKAVYASNLHRAYVGNLDVKLSSEVIKTYFEKEVGVSVVKISAPSMDKHGQSCFVFIDFVDEDQLDHVLAQTGTAMDGGRPMHITRPKNGTIISHNMDSPIAPKVDNVWRRTTKSPSASVTAPTAAASAAVDTTAIGEAAPSSICKVSPSPSAATTFPSVASCGGLSSCAVTPRGPTLRAAEEVSHSLADANDGPTDAIDAADTDANSMCCEVASTMETEGPMLLDGLPDDAFHEASGGYGVPTAPPFCTFQLQSASPHNALQLLKAATAMHADSPQKRPSSGHCAYVGNLPNGVSTEEVKVFIETTLKVRGVIVRLRVNPKNGATFAFVEFDSRNDLEAAVLAADANNPRKLVLRGRTIKINVSNSTSNASL